jgi:hypothetical protein
MNWSPKRWALLLACVAVLTFIVILGRTESGKANAKTSWEYKVVKEQVMVETERSLNQFGMDGWELVYFMRTDQRSELEGTWIFKRPK